MDTLVHFGRFRLATLVNPKLTVTPQVTKVTPQVTIEAQHEQTSIQELCRMGVSREDIDAVLTTQAAQRRNGSPAVDRRHRRGRPAAAKAQPEPACEPTDRAMRKRGTYDRCATLDQQALAERSPERRAGSARQAAKIAKDLSAAQQLEFDFLEGATCPSHSNIRTP